MGVEVPLHCHAHGAPGEGAGELRCCLRVAPVHADFVHRLICLLGGCLQDKCCQYWPAEETATYGDYTVEQKGDTLCDTFSLRDLVLTFVPVSSRTAQQATVITVSVFVVFFSLGLKGNCHFSTTFEKADGV